MGWYRLIIRTQIGPKEDQRGQGHLGTKQTLAHMRGSAERQSHSRESELDVDRNPSPRILAVIKVIPIVVVVDV